MFDLNSRLQPPVQYMVIQLVITIPSGIAYTGTDPTLTAAVVLTLNHVSRRGGATLGTADLPLPWCVTIPLDKIDVGQRVVITYTRKAPITGTDSFSATIGDWA